ncbi:hypothetical protein MMC17_008217 [Xylographa soralifera]|nr:hypothetical protein [Xylographa soralifera]
MPVTNHRARQPIKAAWIGVAIFIISVRILLLSIYFIPKSLRQNPNWTYRQALSNELLKSAFYHITQVQWIKSISLDPGAEKDRFIIIPPTKDIYHDVMKTGGIKPSAVGGTWYPKFFQVDDKQSNVYLHFHGGSFIWGEGRVSDGGFAASLLLQQTPARALFVQYRLGSDPASPFPAALQDALTAYQYLLDLGIPSSKIIVSGDSAGGNIAIGLMRYLASHKSESLLRPAALLLWSLSVDLAAQSNPESVDLHKNFNTDYIYGATLAWGLKQYIPKDVSVHDPYLSPIGHPFITEVPIWVMVGGAEVLYDSIVTFTNKMLGATGNRVELYEAPSAPHDIFLIGNLLGWSKEAEVAAQAASVFVDQNTGAVP